MALLPKAYQTIAEAIAAGIDAPTWLVGGWLLAQATKRPYVGDVDLLVQSPPSDLRRNLQASFPLAERTPRGGMRIPLRDGNHVDVHSTASLHPSGSIGAALNAFPFTANGVALLLGPQRTVVQTEDYEAAIASDTFSFTSSYVRRVESDGLSLLRDAGRLRCAYGLRPTTDTAAELMRLHDQSREELDTTSPAALASSAWRRISHLVPAGAEVWLCRGAVRASLLGGFDEWDDLDFLVNCGIDELKAHLNLAEVRFSLSYHGTPKIRLKNGRHIDLIPIEKGQTALSILGEFFPSTESKAVNVQSGELLAPEPTLDRCRSGQLDSGADLQRLAGGSRRYLALKSLYLVGRHHLELGPALQALVNEPARYSFFDLRNATRLTQELSVRANQVSPPCEAPVAGVQSAVSLYRALGANMDLNGHA